MVRQFYFAFDIGQNKSEKKNEGKNLHCIENIRNTVLKRNGSLSHITEGFRKIDRVLFLKSRRWRKNWFATWRKRPTNELVKLRFLLMA